ncbi:hypothetical protein IPZ58_33510 [Streptomyces roseoverticillatus]|uniref:hypothetical protein n=1 Tax=Streptomyces roseoverticillatus TaxID=66429 RepID=UPI001F171A67|nr:hypothetical protein [Streptomyces roseoverticillatus]MCF3106448.1 hypothetical protein [Streptomyces roseoverticillatus]
MTRCRQCLKLALARATAVRDGRWGDVIALSEARTRHEQEHADQPEESVMSVRPSTPYVLAGGHGKPQDEGDGHPGQPWTPEDEPTPDGSTPPGGGTHGK